MHFTYEWRLTKCISRRKIEKFRCPNNFEELNISIFEQTASLSTSPTADCQRAQICSGGEISLVFSTVLRAVLMANLCSGRDEFATDACVEVGSRFQKQDWFYPNWTLDVCSLQHQRAPHSMPCSGKTGPVLGQ